MIVLKIYFCLHSHVLQRHLNLPSLAHPRVMQLAIAKKLLFFLVQVKFRILAVGSSRVGTIVLPVPNDAEGTREMQPSSATHPNGHDWIFRLVKIK